MANFYGLCPSLSVTVLLAIAASPLAAQIVPDTSLPQNSIVVPNDNIFVIDGGTAAGSNLFHSFASFSVPLETTAFFNSSPLVQTIFARVTGDNISSIEGTIAAPGNLFLLNPNGIIFGPEARLQIGGSFVGSTAQSIVFADGIEFSTVTSESTAPLLSVSVPIGLQMGPNPGAIVNRSIATSPVPLPDLDPNFPIGLGVQPGQTLALIGGDLALESGNLTAFSGEVRLASAASPGLVAFSPTPTGIALNLDSIETLGNIDLSGTSAINVSGPGGGAIALSGGNISLRDRTSLLAATLGNIDGRGIEITGDRLRIGDETLLSTATFGVGRGGDLTLQAETIAVTGVGFETLLQVQTGVVLGSIGISDVESGIVVGSQGMGDAGTTTIAADRFAMTDGALLATTTGASGRGGDVNIRTSESVEVNGSGLFTGALQGTTGNSGSVTLDTERLQVLNGGTINVFTFGSGTGGNLTVNATESVEILDTPAGAVLPVGLFANSIFGTGPGGNIEVNTDRMVMAGGGQVGNQSGALLGTGLIPVGGPGGNVVLNVTGTIEISGISPDGRFGSGPGATSFGSSPSGSTTIVAENLVIRDGASIEGTALSSGRGGDIAVTVGDRLELVGTGTANRQGTAVEFPSTIGSSSGREDFANLQATGDAGALQIQAGEIIVRDGAQITVDSLGTGNAGLLEITADTIRLEGGNFNASTNSGQGGNIVARSNTLQLRNGSAIATNAGNTDGGNITLSVETLAALENSDITANALEGRGGQVSITAEGIFGTEFREFLTPDSDITATSALGAEFSGVVEIDTPDVDSTAGLVELDVDTVDPSSQIVRGCAAENNTFAVVGRGGLPENPTVGLHNTTSWSDNRNWRSIAGVSNSVETGSTPLSPTLREATTWTIAPNGKIALVSPVPTSATLPQPECD